MLPYLVSSLESSSHGAIDPFPFPLLHAARENVACHAAVVSLRQLFLLDSVRGAGCCRFIGQPSDTAHCKDEEMAGRRRHGDGEVELAVGGDRARHKDILHAQGLVRAPC